MRKINLKRVVTIVLFGLPLQMVVADDLPKPFNLARYQVMMDRSPFAVATAVATPETAPNFAKDLYVANAAQSKEGGLVTIASSTDKNFKKYLTTNAPVDGYSISNIEWSDKVGATKVTIAKDGQSATIGFNEATLRQPGQPGANPGAPPAFQQPQQSKQDSKQDPKQDQSAALNVSSALAAPQQNQPNQAKPMPVPMLPPAQPAPHVRGVIPRNPPGAPPAKPGS